MQITNKDTETKATLYRMVMDKHIYPYGLKSKALLQSQGYHVDDQQLTSTEQTQTFKREYDVETTPQVFIGGQRIGGYEDLREHLGLRVSSQEAASYRPITAVFAMTGLMAVAISWLSTGGIFTLSLLPIFIALSMCVLAIQKLRDLESFSSMFLNYDLLARRWVRYSYIYPFGEAVAGLLMLSGALPWISGPIAFLIGMIGAVSVVKAVYIEKRELKCACVGGGTNVPLGPISLTENLMMMLMGAWTLL